MPTDQTYRVVRVVRASSTRWHVVNHDGKVLCWTTDPTEAYRLADLMNQ